jgi:Clp amino terminal domain, pathogenicity island component
MAPPPAISLSDIIRSVEAEADDLPLSRLRTASELVRELEEIGDAGLGYFVDQARHAGHSWSEIGEALGVTKQAAQQRQSVRVSLGLNPPTFERLTARARRVLDAAEPVARSWGHSYIGTEHLLLALYREPDGVAAQILVESGLPPTKAEAAVSGRVGRGPGSPEGKLPFTPKAMAVFNGALASALEMGHNYIGTEHLLIGLTRGGGVGADVLTEFGLTGDSTARRVAEKLAGYRS